MKANENPFRSSSVEQIRYALPTASLKSLCEQALTETYSCLLGPKGTGKTTLLEDLEPHIRQRGCQTHWIRLNLESTKQDRRNAIDQLATFGEQDVCLFDGAEVLSWWQWLKLRNAAKTQHFKLIATLHKQRGIPILLNTDANWSLAKQFIEQLAGDHYTIELHEQAKRSFDKNQGNMREVFRSCYLFLAQVSN